MSNKPSIEVCLSPNMWPLFDARDKTVVVIDILRATTTIAVAFQNHIDKIIPVETIEECIAYRDHDNYLLAAEREGLKPAGFSFGNSPFDYAGKDLKGKTLILTTTNGTQCIKKSVGAKNIVTGAFSNLDSVCKYVLSQKDSCLLFCAGWKGQFNLEDTLFAGAVCDRLQNDFIMMQDAALAAKLLFSQSEDYLLDVIKRTSHYQRLGRFGLEDDIEFCMSMNTTQVVPLYKDGALILMN